MEVTSVVAGEMSFQDKLALCNLQLELKLERSDLVKELMKIRTSKKSLCKPKRKRGRPSKAGVEPVKNVKPDLPKKRKHSPKFCWGCLEEGKLKNMHVPHYVNGFKEVYADMAKYCFSTQVKKDDRTNYICETCIQKLRDTMRFRKQIFIAQDYLNQVTGCPPLKLKSNTGQEAMKLTDEAIRNKDLPPPPPPCVPDGLSLNRSITSVVDKTARGVVSSLTLPPSVATPPKSPFNLVPIKRSSLSSPIYIVRKQGDKSAMFNIARRTFVNNTIGKKLFIVKPTPKPTLGALDPNCIVQVEDSSDEDVEGERCKEEISNNKMSPYLNIPIEIDIENNKQPSTTEDDCYIQDDEYNQQSDYITYQDFTTDTTLNTNTLADSCCRCPVCHDEFTTIKGRREHLHSEHSECISIHMCEECGATLASNSSLKRHIRDVHLKFTPQQTI